MPDHADQAEAKPQRLVSRRGPWRQALARFRRKPVGVGAGFVFAAFVVVAAFAGSIAPYAVRTSDPFELTALFVVTALVVSVFTLVGDVLVGLLDPRVSVASDT